VYTPRVSIPQPNRVCPADEEEDAMGATVAKVSEISAKSDKSFEDAISKGIARADKTLRNITSAWVKEQQVQVKKGKVVGYQVNLLVTFVLDD
jgi:flavin-binding protein dodecin